MDLFTTALELGHVEPPTDRIIDGRSLLPALLNNQVDPDRVVYYYRGNEMMAVRHGLYKAHYWTWTNSLEERAQVGTINIKTTLLHINRVLAIMRRGPLYASL